MVALGRYLVFGYLDPWGMDSPLKIKLNIPTMIHAEALINTVNTWNRLGTVLSQQVRLCLGNWLLK